MTPPVSDFSGIQGVVVDLDGTMYDSAGAIPGAAAAVDALRAAGLGIRFVTNTTRRPHAEVVNELRRIGIDVDPEDVLTAPRACANWLREQSIRSIAVHLPESTLEDFEGFVVDERSPDAVVVGDLGSGWTYERLNLAFRQLMADARLIAIQKNRFWRTPSGLALDAGPFVAALEYASDTKAVTVGKPSRAFFDAAARSLGLSLSRLVVIGDDVASDVEGAHAAGAHGVLVKTGKFSPRDLENQSPEAVLESVAGLPSLLGIG